MEFTIKKLQKIMAVAALLQASGSFAAAVQAGAFSVPSNAQNMVQRLSGMGYTAVAARKGDLQVVRIENLSNSGANNACDRLQSSGINCFVSGGNGRSYSAPRRAAVASMSVETLTPVIANTYRSAPVVARPRVQENPTYVTGSDFSL